MKINDIDSSMISNDENAAAKPSLSDIIRISFLGKVEGIDEHGYIVSHVRTHKDKQYTTNLCVETKSKLNVGDVIYVVGIVKGVFGRMISVIPSRVVVAHLWW